MPSKYASEELVGRWGFTSYQKEADRARTINTARGLCRSPYVIAKGPGGGVMMHLADERQPTELRLKGDAAGRNFIGPDGKSGQPQDREIVSFDGACWSRATSIPTPPSVTATWSTSAARQGRRACTHKLTLRSTLSSDVRCCTNSGRKADIVLSLLCADRRHQGSAQAPQLRGPQIICGCLFPRERYCENYKNHKEQRHY